MIAKASQQNIDLRGIFLLNNEGCQLLSLGRYGAATSCLSMALRRIRQHCNLLSSLQHESEDLTIATPYNVADIRPPSLSKRALDDYYNSSTTMESRWYDANHHYIFSRGIPCIVGCSFSFDWMKEAEIVASIVLFNLALSKHLQGIQEEQQGSQDRENNSPCMRQARLLYQQCYSILAPLIHLPRQKNATQTQNAAFDLLVMATLNNLAVVSHSRLARASSSQDCANSYSVHTLWEMLADFCASSLIFSPHILSSDLYVGESADHTSMDDVRNMLVNVVIFRRMQRTEVASAA